MMSNIFCGSSHILISEVATEYLYYFNPLLPFMPIFLFHVHGILGYCYLIAACDSTQFALPFEKSHMLKQISKMNNPSL